MRLAILSAGDGWHVRDLCRAAADHGHQAVTVDFRRLVAAVPPTVGHASSVPEVPSVPGNTETTKGLIPGMPGTSGTLEACPTKMQGYDAILVRTMPPGSLEQVVFRMDLLQRLEAQGVRVLNAPRTLEVCVDKYLATARLAAAGLPVPETIVCQHADAGMEAFALLGSDVVVKPLFGSEGRGMMRISDPELAWRTFRTLERTGAVLYLQRFIRHPGWDVRVFVLGGRVLTAMRRVARGDWRTNVAQGGRGEPMSLDREQERLALAAAAALGGQVAGVDLLPGPQGEWYVLEVNAVPGWRALAPVTGIDVAGAVMAYLTEGPR